MGRLLPFIILFALLALGGYAVYQTYIFLGNRPSITLPKINLGSSNPTPTPEPTPTPDLSPQIQIYLESHLLSTKSKCVYELLGSENTNIYVWAICQDSKLSISIPVVLDMSSSDSAILSHQSPRAGDHYDSDFNNLFPSKIRSNPFFTNPTGLEILQQQLSK